MEFVRNPAHKTILILDRGPKFAKFSEIEFEVTYKDGTKQKKAGFAPKTLWNCSLDCTVEFHRIISDIFPSGTHLVRYIVSEVTSQFVFNRWHNVALNQEEFIQALYDLGCVEANPETDQSTCSILNAVGLAVDAFTQWSPHQKRADAFYKTKFYNKTQNTFEIVKSDRELEPICETDGIDFYLLENSCTLIVITSFDNIEQEFQKLVETIEQNMNDKNRIIDDMKNDEETPLDSLKVFILNIVDDSDSVKDLVLPIDKIANERLKFRLFNINGKMMTPYLHRVLLDAYDLVSTTIKGIPMKEDAQPGKSLDYDVEIFHPRSLHDQLRDEGLLVDNSPIISKVAIGGYNTVALKWCNPVQKLRKDAYPIREACAYSTPADLLSRPTICVVTFMKKGKCIWLELPETSISKLEPNISGKVVSHILTFDASRQGMALHAMSLGSNLKAKQSQMNKITSEDGDEFSSGMLLIDEAFLTKFDEEPMVEIMSRMEAVYIDEPDPFMFEFPSEKSPEKEPDIFPVQKDNLTLMKNISKDLVFSLGFSPESFSCYHDNPEFADIRKLLKKKKQITTEKFKDVLTKTHKNVDKLIKRINKNPGHCYPQITVDACLLSVNSLLDQLRKDFPHLYYQFFNEIAKIFFKLADSRGLTKELKLNRKRRPIYDDDGEVSDEEILEPSPKFFCITNPTNTEILKPIVAPASPMEDGEHIDDNIDDIDIVKS
uniref:Protein asunder n=1 Tax=Panagrolaimus sp. PS1159 TaxID=55785 RepID=A0AC35FHJ7_9BILA